MASIDAKIVDCGEYECFSNNGKIPTGKDPAEWAVELERSGAGEILITSIEQDGTMGGYDIDLVKEISESVSIPVIASGGARDYLHMLDALQIGGASAVATASIF